MKNYSIFDKIKRIKPISVILSLMNPGYSRCEKCGLPWYLCEVKCVYYSENSGTFATCDYCWDHSTLDQLKLYYMKVYRMQEKSTISIGYKMSHTLQDLLNGVEIEYYKDLSENERIKQIRKNKLNKILKQ